MPIPYCGDNCGCPPGTACNLETNLCEVVPYECNVEDGDCQCPDNYECIDNECEPTNVTEPDCSDSNPCDYNEYCHFGECESCPTFEVSDNFGVDDDCKFNLTVTSSKGGWVQIQVLFNTGYAYDELKWFSGDNSTFVSSKISTPLCSVSNPIVILTREDCPPVAKALEPMNCENGCGRVLDNQQMNMAHDEALNEVDLSNDNDITIDENVVDVALNNDVSSEKEIGILPKFNLFPNPFNNKIEMVIGDVEESFDGELFIMDNLGRIVRKENLNIVEGENRFTFDNLESLSSGVYIVLLKKDGLIYATKNMVRME